MIILHFDTCEALCDPPVKLGTCRKFDEICFFVDWLNAVKAFLIIAIVLYLLVIIYLIIMVWGRGMTIRMIGIDLLFAGMSFSARSVTFHRFTLCPGGNLTYPWYGVVPFLRVPLS